MEGHDPFSRNVGSKLLFGAFMLLIFGAIALVLVPLLGFGMEGGPGIMPGLILLVVAVILGVLAGLLLGYDKARHGQSAD